MPSGPPPGQVFALRMRERWEADERPEPRSLGLLPSGPDPVGEWLVHCQPPAPISAQRNENASGGEPRSACRRETVGGAFEKLPRPRSSPSFVPSRRACVVNGRMAQHRRGGCRAGVIQCPPAPISGPSRVSVMPQAQSSARPSGARMAPRSRHSRRSGTRAPTSSPVNR